MNDMCRHLRGLSCYNTRLPRAFASGLDSLAPFGGWADSAEGNFGNPTKNGWFCPAGPVLQKSFNIVLRRRGGLRSTFSLIPAMAECAKDVMRLDTKPARSGDPGLVGDPGLRSTGIAEIYRRRGRLRSTSIQGNDSTGRSACATKE